MVDERLTSPGARRIEHGRRQGHRCVGAGDVFGWVADFDHFEII